MARRMEQFEVDTTEEGMISIKQENYTGDISTIIISPDQVEVLCQWLKEERDKNKKEAK